MARIVPEGYADIKQYDEFGDTMQVLDWLTKIGGMYKESKNEWENDVAQALTSAVDMSQYVSDDSGMTALTNSLDHILSEANRTGNKNLMLSADMAKNLHDSRTDKYKNFKNTMNEVLALSGSSEGMFHPSKMNVDSIMTWDPENIRSMYEKLDMYDAKLRAAPKAGQAQGELLFQNYTIGEGEEQETVNTVNNRLVNSKKQMDMALSSFLGDGLITREEAEFIITASKTELKTHRETVITQSTNNIRDYGKSSSQASRAITSLEREKDSTLLALASDNSFLKDMISTASQDGTITDDMIQTAGHSMEELRTGGGGKAGMDLYNEIIKQLKRERLNFETLIESEIKRFNKWSPVQWSADLILGDDISGVDTSTKKKIKEKIKEGLLKDFEFDKSLLDAIPSIAESTAQDIVMPSIDNQQEADKNIEGLMSDAIIKNLTEEHDKDMSKSDKETVPFKKTKTMIGKASLKTMWNNMTQKDKKFLKENYDIHNFSQLNTYAGGDVDSIPALPEAGKMAEGTKKKKSYESIYNNLSEENQTRIKQYYLAKASQDKNLYRFPLQVFYEMMTDEELAKILR